MKYATVPRGGQVQFNPRSTDGESHAPANTNASTTRSSVSNWEAIMFEGSRGEIFSNPSPNDREVSRIDGEVGICVVYRKLGGERKT